MAGAWGDGHIVWDIRFEPVEGSGPTFLLTAPDGRARTVTLLGHVPLRKLTQLTDLLERPPLESGSTGWAWVDCAAGDVPRASVSFQHPSTRRAFAVEVMHDANEASDKWCARPCRHPPHVSGSSTKYTVAENSALEAFLAYRVEREEAAAAAGWACALM